MPITPSTYMKKVFTGFSTVGSTQQENFKMYDVNLVRQDLLNHFNTRVGERVMRPTFGCKIWDYLMEPYSDYVRGLVESEVKRIIASEPRVEMTDYNVYTFEHGIVVEVLLNYLPFYTSDQLLLTFENTVSQTGF